MTRHSISDIREGSLDDQDNALRDNVLGFLENALSLRGTEEWGDHLAGWAAVGAAREDGGASVPLLDAGTVHIPLRDDPYYETEG